MGNSDEIVIYDNTFNKTNLSLLTQVQTDVLMVVLSRMGKTIDESGRFVADFHFKDIREMTDMKELYSSRLKKTFDELLNTQVEFFSDNVYYKGNLFSNYNLTKKNEARITLSTDMTKKIGLSKGQFTVLELPEYISLKNKHSKELYRLLRQFRHSGLFVIKKSDLIKYLKPPKSYNEYDFIRKILIPAIEDNKKYFNNLKISKLEGNSLPSVCQFSFSKHKKTKLENKVNDTDAEEEELLKYIMENGGSNK